VSTTHTAIKKHQPAKLAQLVVAVKEALKAWQNPANLGAHITPLPVMSRFAMFITKQLPAAMPSAFGRCDLSLLVHFIHITSPHYCVLPILKVSWCAGWR
jgi:hypothetical protein